MGAWTTRVCVSALLLALIFYFVPFSQVWAAARQISAALWLSALVLFLCGHAAAAAKWRILIGSGISYRQAFRAHLAGLAANLALPSVAGGDVVRAGLVMKHAHDKGRLAMGSLADRLLDTLGLIMIALGSAWIAWGHRQDSRIWVGWPLLGLLVLVVTGFAAALVLDRSATSWEPSGKLMRLSKKLIHSTAELVRSPGRLLLCMIISMTIQCLFVGINIAFARAAHVEAPVAAWFYAWTTAKIIAIAPLSLGGLGLREASMAGLLKPFGANFAQVVAIGLVWQSVLYASGLIGFLVQLQRFQPSVIRAGQA
ncbi:MAG: lysylphosphatidylglycerol synthase transmembrane domain-containing protein [Sphingomicrobium sp.]